MSFRQVTGFIVGILTAISVCAAPQPYSDRETAAIAAFVSDTFSNIEFSMVIGLVDEKGTRVFWRRPARQSGWNVPAQ